MKTKLKIHFIVPYLILMGVLLVATGVRADQNWYVLSEYSSQLPGQPATEVVWEFELQSFAAGGYEWLVQDRDEMVGCRAELYFTSSGALEQADCYRKIRGEEVCDARQYMVSRPALLNQTLIPGDWFNRPLSFVFQADNQKVTLYEQIGTARFANYIEIQDQEISRENALEQGMIRNDLQAGLLSGNSQFYLVEIRRAGNGNSSQAPLLQQLWRVGDNFWLYESKAGRRSWRLLQK